MNEWRVYPPDDYDDTWGYSIKEWGENARTLRVVADSLTEAEAQQIVREHNAHAEMVESVKSGKESMRSLFDFIQHSLIPFLEVSAPNSEFMKRIDNLKEAANEIPDEIARIDAVLARAEGRTK